MTEVEKRYIDDEIVLIDEKAGSIILKDHGPFKYSETIKPYLEKYKVGDKVNVTIYGDPEQITFIKKSGEFKNIPKKPEVPKKPTSDQEKKDQGWVMLQGKLYPTLEVLLNIAKEMYPGRLRIQTFVVQLDTQKQFAIMNAVVRNVDDEGRVIEEYYGTGDAGPDTLAKHMQPSYIRMAETRAIVRALRWMTNIGQASIEEIPEEEKKNQNPENWGKATLK